ncbi:MAG: hypothetical protein HKN91_12335 [Acidimicrobiia bacterium]|nr:hypothetical protein [Acidimicrobiia bacterium]
MDKTASPTLQDVPRILLRGVDNYKNAFVPASGMAILVLALYGTARVAAQSSVSSNDLGVAFAIDAIGLVVATVVALPWFRLALRTEWRIEADAQADLSEVKWRSMVVSALFFWGGMLVLLRYGNVLGVPALVLIPVILMLVWYGLFGFAAAAGIAPGLKALGTSVRLGQGRRGTVAAVAISLALLNLLGLSPIGSGVNPATIAATILLLTVTTNVSMGAGAHLFDWLVRSESQ